MDFTEIVSTVSSIMQKQLLTIAGTSINLTTLLLFAVIILLSAWSARLTESGIHRFFRRRGIRDEGSLAVSGRLAHYVVMAVGLGIGVHTLGINLTALFAAGAVFAIGLGFAMQNIAQNFVSGLILLVERAIKPGDVLEVDGRLVRVVRMGIRATVSRTLDDEDLIIPNSTLVQSTVKNYTLRDPHYRVRSAVGVVYGSDMALVRRTLEEAARNFPGRDPGTEPRILLLGFGTSSVDFEVSIWTTNPWRMRTVRSELNETIWWAFKSAGVTIAFPQLDVHFDPPIADSLHALAAH